MTAILLISGSVRAGSTNTAVLRTAAALSGDDVQTDLLAGIGALPLFNPDDDREGAEPDRRVAAMRAAVARADALLICTPEYAGALPAAMKNLLEWTIGDAGTHAKPVAWINAAGPAAPTGAADAHDSLATVLRYAGADVVAAACVRVPVTAEMVGADGRIDDVGARASIAAALAELICRVRREPGPAVADRPGPLAHLVADAAAQIRRFEPAEAFAELAHGGVIIDIRDGLARERDGVAAPSLHIPRTVLEWRVAQESPWRNPHVGGRERPLILLCDHGYSSVLAAANLVRLGFSGAGDVVGGFEAWAAAGLPVTAAPPRREDGDGLPGMDGPAG